MNTRSNLIRFLLLLALIAVQGFTPVVALAQSGTSSTTIPSGATLDVHIQIYNGLTLVKTYTLAFPIGTYGFTQSGLPFTMTSAYTKLVVTLEYKATSGTVWFDDAHLVWAP
jgi:hypothetical protein